MSLRSAVDHHALRLWMQTVKHLQFQPFRDSLADPQKTQQATLRSILSRNQDTAFGKHHDLRSIRSEREFRSRIPIHSYEDLRPYIERQIASDAPELNPTKPLMYAQTSGTTGKPKYIPLCRETLRAFRHTQRLSSYLQQAAAPGLFAGKLLALVSPMIEGHLDNGTPFGSMSGVVRHSLPSIIRSKSLLPQTALDALDYEDRYRLISAIAISAPDITCFASANPSTFLRLSDIIGSHFDQLLEFLETGRPESLGVKQCPAALKALCQPTASRLAALKQLAKKGSAVTFADLWPDLRGVVTWTSGNCSLLLPKLSKQLAPTTRIIEMGYLASEFWGTIAVDANLGVPTIGDNFFEFIEPDAWEAGSRETTLLADLQPNTRYYIITTTPNGLYRYFINDLVEVSGRYQNTPTIAFVQKGKGVTTLTGEKLYEGQVIEAVQQSSARLHVELDSFIMLAHRDRFAYTLYLEAATAPDLAAYEITFNDALSAINLEYAAKLKSGRLQPTSIKRLKPGTFDAYKRAAISSGQREGQFKTIKLQYSDELAFNFEEHLWQAI